MQFVSFERSNNCDAADAEKEGSLIKNQIVKNQVEISFPF